MSSFPVTIKQIVATATINENRISCTTTIRQITTPVTINYGLSSAQVQTLINEAIAAIPAITVDSALSETSENPVQNKIVTAEFAKHLAYIAELSDCACPITIDSLTYELTGDEEATITCVASQGVGTLTYTLYLGETEIESNETGIFIVESEGTYTVEVSDEIGSTPAEEDIIIYNLWATRIKDLYIEDNDECIFTVAQELLIIDRLTEDYVLTTFGPDGLNKSVCDFFIFWETQNKYVALQGGTFTKTGATVRWNYGGGNVYEQNNMPAQLCESGVITLTSIDGWAGVTYVQLDGNQFINNFSGCNFPNTTRIRAATSQFNYIQTYNWDLMADLILSNNLYLKSLNPKTFSKLEQLNITDTRIEQLDFDYPTPTRLRYCTLVRNRLKNIDYFDSFNRLYTYLGYGNLLNNMVLDVKDESTGLQQINLKDSRLTTLGNLEFKSPSLNTIDISNSYLDDVDTLFLQLKEYYVDLNITPTANLSVDVSGGQNAILTDGSSNANLIALQSHFTSKGKTFTASFNSTGYDAAVNTYLSEEITIKDYEFNSHNGFGNIIFYKNDMYCFYRAGTSHQSVDGRLMLTIDAETRGNWSTPIELYSGQELITDQERIDYPRINSDVRDIRLLRYKNNILVFGFVAFGYNLLPSDTEPADPENIDERVSVKDSKSFCLVIPIDPLTDTLQTNELTINYIDDYAFSGGVALKNDVIYTTLYSASIDPRIYKSNDGGDTWTYIASLFVDNLANETAIAFINNRLYAVARTFDSGGMVAYSDNKGATWSVAVSAPYSIDGISMIVNENDELIIFGRRAAVGYATSLYKMDKDTFAEIGTIITVNEPDSADSGYGNIILKDDYYYLSYFDGITRQYPNSKTHANVGMYYKKILAEKIDDIT